MTLYINMFSTDQGTDFVQVGESTTILLRKHLNRPGFALYLPSLLCSPTSGYLASQIC